MDDFPGLAPTAILAFWFEEIQPSRWWTQSPAFDEEIARRFGEVHRAAARCELFFWRKTPLGRLAEIIVLDQFSRHIHRGRAAAFACDPLALALAQTAVALGADEAMDGERRSFLYLPFVHSESLLIHQSAEALFKAPGLEKALQSEQRHRAVIERFGRYPHRNKTLCRASTFEEVAFLNTPGSRF
jgi:uncharacterized protein (DUF924 family)